MVKHHQTDDQQSSKTMVKTRQITLSNIIQQHGHNHQQPLPTIIKRHGKNLITHHGQKSLTYRIQHRQNHDQNHQQP
jgi:hypothetical protein